MAGRVKLSNRVVEVGVGMMLWSNVGSCVLTVCHQQLVLMMTGAHDESHQVHLACGSHCIQGAGCSQCIKAEQPVFNMIHAALCGMLKHAPALRNAKPGCEILMN